jgi:hypothetical protein
VTAAWPATLPEFLEGGATETLPNERLESAISNGAPIARRRIRGKTREFDATIYCPAESVPAFEHFYRDTLSDGVLPFTWVHPRTRVAGVFKFKGAAPAYAPRGSGEVVMISFKLGRVR